MESMNSEVDVAEKFREGSLGEILQIVAGWNEEASKKGLFMILLENDVRIQETVDSLAEKFDQGWEADAQTREDGVTAARIYIKLVLVPGSNAFQIFHPQLYEKVLDYTKQCASLVLQNESFDTSARNKSSVSIRGSQKGKRSKRRRSSLEEEEEEEARPELGQREASTLKKNLHILLQDIIILLEKFPLKSSVGSAVQTIRTLVHLTRQEANTFDCNFDNRASPGRQSIPALAYKGIQLMWSEQHGSLTSMIESTFKNLLPNLLMLEDDVETANRHITTVQSQATKFVCHLVERFGESCLGPVRTLLQHMCMDVPDKTDIKVKVASSVLAILKSLPLENYCSMIQWICKLARHKETSCRSFATEVAASLLSSPLRPVDEDLVPDLVPYTSYKTLLETVYESCSDSAPGVRAKALSYIGACLRISDDQLIDALRDIIIPGFTTLNMGARTMVNTPGAMTLQGDTPGSSTLQETTPGTTTLQGTSNFQGTTTIAADGSSDLTYKDGLFSLLRMRARDEKVLVRKAALQTLEYAVKFEKDSYSQENVKVLLEHCRDPGLSARKQAMLSLTELLKERLNDEYILLSWLTEALRLIDDKEQTLADKCMENLEGFLLLHIVDYSKSKADSHLLAWRILGILSEPTRGNERGYLTLACKLWGEQKQITPRLVNALLSHVGTENNMSAWMFLAEVAPYASKVNHGTILTYWKCLNVKECPIAVQQWVLVTLSYIAKHLCSEDRVELITDLKSRLLEFQTPVELVVVTIETLSTLCTVEAEKTKSRSDQKEWLGQLLRATDIYLSQALLEFRESAVDEEKLGCHLCTFGEAALIYPGKVPERAVLMVKSILASSGWTSVPDSQGRETDKGTDADQSTESQSSQASTDSQQTQASSQASSRASSQAPSQPCSQASSQASQALSQFGSSNMPSRIRSMAILTLGKICLKKHSLAKKYVGAMVRELETSTDPGIRNNLMIVLCDLARRYTSVASQYIGHIFSCLRDPAALVRLQTLKLITELLQQDYLKWKGDLFYRFLACILDDFGDTRQYAEDCLEQLLARNSLLFVSHFVEAMYVYNDCTDHKTYNKYPQNKGEFHFKGEENKTKRKRLYNFLLGNMKDEQKFTAITKLCQEVLGAVVDDLLPLASDSSPVLKDALTILASKEIKLSVMKDNATGDEDDTTEDQTINVTDTMKRVIICRVMKSNISDHIIPTVLSLKHVLDKKRSPLLKELLMYLRELMKDFKAEVQAALAEHKDLAKEIEFDLRKFEEQQRQEVQQQTGTPAVQVSTVAKTPPYLGSPNPRSTPTSASRGTPRGTPRAAARGTPRPTTGGTPTPAPRGTPASGGTPTPVPRNTPVPTPRGSPRATARDMTSPQPGSSRDCPATTQVSPQPGSSRDCPATTQVSPQQGTSQDYPATAQYSPAQGTTRARFVTAQVSATPGASATREPHLPSMALFNLIQKRREAEAGSPKVKVTTPKVKITTPKVKVTTQAPSPASRDSSAAESAPSTGLRLTREAASRAISTPSVAMSNITFYDGGKTAPSPIPKHMARTTYDDTDPSLTGPTPTPASPKRLVLLNFPPEATARPTTNDTPKAPTAAHRKRTGENVSPNIQNTDQSPTSKPRKGKRARKR